MIRNIYSFFEKIHGFFEKEVFVHFEEVHYSENDELKKRKDCFSITVCKYGKCHTHFGKIPWEDVDKIIDILQRSKGKVLLSINVGMGISEIMIPKWAKVRIIEQLEKEL